MVTLSELRMNNWVMWQNVPVKITSPALFERTFYKIQEGRVYGIPLTPEILQKAGFEYKEPNPVFKTGVFRKWIDVSLVALIPENGYYSLQANPLCKIQYFHQLQTLYFALTGEELQIDF